MKYVNYVSSMEGGVIDLLNMCFPGKGITPRSFRWKHADNYFEGKFIAMVAIEGDTICSFVCFTPVTVVRNNQKYQFYSCAVQATHPDFRRRGLVSTLTKEIEKQLGDASYFGFSNESGLMIDKHSKTINYAIVGRLKTRYILPISFKSSYKIAVATTPDPIFLQQVKPAKFQFLKDLNYLKWRYTDNPKNRYLLLELKNNELIDGYVVVRENSFKCEICALIVKDEISVKSMLSAVGMFLLRRGRFIQTLTFLPNNSWREGFPPLSFEKDTNMYFTVKTNLGNEFLAPNNWMIAGGDIQ